MASRPSLLSVVLALLPSFGRAGEPEQAVQRWRAHYAAVERELRAYPPSGLTEKQREARASLLWALAAYRERGDFTRQERQEEAPGALVPRFVDDEGRVCAVAMLLRVSGREDLVERVRRSRNDAWIADLAGSKEFLSWLESSGLTLEEAGRIQTPALDSGGSYRGPSDEAPGERPGGRGDSAGDEGEASRPSSPSSAPAGALPSIGSPFSGARAGARALDAWWVWWEFNKLAYLDLPGLEARLMRGSRRSSAEVREMTEPLRMTRRPLLVGALAEPEALVRASAALALGRIGGEDSVAPLTALLADSSQRVREHALLGLGASGTSAAAQVLLGMLEHGGRRSAQGELVTTRALPLAILSLAVGRRAGMDQAVAGAVALLAPRANEVQRPSALWAACLFQRLAPDPALEALCLKLAASREMPTHVRAAAIEALGASSDPFVLARLQDALLGRELELRRSAALALGRCPQALATGALMTAYELESEPLARGFLLLSLGQRGGKPSRDLLLEALASGPLAVEPWAALALGLHARASSDAGITKALLEAAPRVRNEDSRPAVLLALALAREPRAAPLALRVLESSASARERGYAATALALLGGKENVESLRARLQLERSGFVRATIAQGLSAQGETADVASLFSALRGLADPGLRAVTAASLGQLGSPAALPGLEELGRATAGSTLVRATALDGLGVLLERGQPLILPEASQGANYALYEDWVFELFLLTL